jgi:hypothetical protein
VKLGKPLTKACVILRCAIRTKDIFSMSHVPLVIGITQRARCMMPKVHEDTLDFSQAVKPDSDYHEFEFLHIGGLL